MESISVSQTLEKQAGKEQQSPVPILALDIGTRSVVGMIGYARDDHFEIADYEQHFHKTHAMRDGQIEDIELVASAVREVKEALEARSGLNFKKAAVAAAGRTLRTACATYTRNLDENEPLTRSFISTLEYAVVDQAQEVFLKENPDSAAGEFFCVGYSITSCFLDGYTYSNLEGHRGKTVTLEAVAAFLPIHVVSCLYAVAERNGLDIENLTLEPIAAINIIVPQDIRLLNIVIVDIGAGTSDIAISRNGSIAAYGMVTIAGDEITETIMRTYLTDFDTAERIKIAWSSGVEEISFCDILGLEKTIFREELQKICSGVVETLCKTISESILSINGGAPMAVFLVGGGSRTPGLCPLIAKMLEIPSERVAIGGNTPFKNITLCSEDIQSPEFVTPIGIGLVCSLYRGCNFFSITVNDRSIMVLDHGSIQVMDALLLAGIKPAKLLGLSSPGISYTLNGQRVIERGNPAMCGRLTVNGQEASIHTLIKQGDVVIALPAENGRPVSLKLSDVCKKLPSINITLDGKKISIASSALVNGKSFKKNYKIKEGDSIISSLPVGLEEVLSRTKTPFCDSKIYTLNGRPAERDTKISEGDVISSRPRQEASAPKRAIPEQAAPKQPPSGLSLNVCINGTWRDISYKKDEPLLFLNMLDLSGIDPKNPQGELVLLLNGRPPAGYLAPVSEGDIVEIRWEKS